MVQVESMSCGTPVIATDLPGVRQPILTTGMGIIVPPQSPDSLANALITLLENPDGFVKDPRMIKNVFSPDTIAEQYEELYHDLL